MKSAETPPLSQLTDNELIELWRRQWHADEDAFCAHYDLPKGSISALAVSAELDEEICSAPCPKCDTSIVLEKNAPFECYKCTAYNGWVIKYKRRQFGALVEAFLVEPKVRISNYSVYSLLALRRTDAPASLLRRGSAFPIVVKQCGNALSAFCHL